MDPVLNTAPDQPREPSGSPEGGRFAKSGSAGTVRTVKHGNLEVKFSKHAKPRAAVSAIPLPHYKQHDEHSCSFIAALTVVHHFDKTISAKTVLKTVRPTKSGGVDGKGLLKALKTLGVNAQYKNDLTVGKLRKHVAEGTPVLVTVWPDDWASDHWTTVRGFSPGRIYLSNHKSMPIKDFKKEWFDHGEGIVCTPKPRATRPTNGESKQVSNVAVSNGLAEGLREELLSTLNYLKDEAAKVTATNSPAAVYEAVGPTVNNLVEAPIVNLIPQIRVGKPDLGPFVYALDQLGTLVEKTLAMMTEMMNKMAVQRESPQSISLVIHHEDGTKSTVKSE